MRPYSGKNNYFISAGYWFLIAELMIKTDIDENKIKWALRKAFESKENIGKYKIAIEYILKKYLNES